MMFFRGGGLDQVKLNESCWFHDVFFWGGVGGGVIVLFRYSNVAPEIKKISWDIILERNEL